MSRQRIRRDRPLTPQERKRRFDEQCRKSGYQRVESRLKNSIITTVNRIAILENTSRSDIIGILVEEALLARRSKPRN